MIVAYVLNHLFIIIFTVLAIIHIYTDVKARKVNMFPLSLLLFFGLLNLQDPSILDSLLGMFLGMLIGNYHRQDLELHGGHLGNGDILLYTALGPWVGIWIFFIFTISYFLNQWTGSRNSPYAVYLLLPSFPLVVIVNVADKYLLQLLIETGGA